MMILELGQIHYQKPPRKPPKPRVAIPSKSWN